MSKSELSQEQKEIVRAQNDALLYLPEDRSDRLELILNYRREKARENDLIAQAKKESGAGDTLKGLIEKKHLKPQAIKTINLLAEMEASHRAMAARQIVSYFYDFNWLIPDLFDEDAIGQQPEEPGQAAAGALFDQTGEGKRRGGKAAAPRKAPEPAAAAAPREIPTIPLDEAQKRFEEELAKRDGKRGPEPKALKEARAVLEKAKADAKPAETEKPPEQPAVEQAAAEAPASNVVSLSQAQRKANEDTDAEIRKQAAKMAADRAGKGPGVDRTPPPPPPAAAAQEPDPPAQKASRKRGGAKKDAAVAAPPPPPPAPPPSLDDDEDEEPGEATFPAGAPGLGAGPERRSPDFRIG